MSQFKIVDTHWVCPYCMTQVDPDRTGHCGESSAHFELAYELDDGSIVLQSELTKGH